MIAKSALAAAAAVIAMFKRSRNYLSRPADLFCGPHTCTGNLFTELNRQHSVVIVQWSRLLRAQAPTAPYAVGSLPAILNSQLFRLLRTVISEAGSLRCLTHLLAGYG